MKAPFPKYDADLVAAIEDYLGLDYQTGIIQTINLGEQSDGLLCHLTAGGDSKSYNRPVFEVFDDGIASAQRISYQSPCPGCDDWSRTSECADHPEREWDDEGRGWGPVPEAEPTASFRITASNLSGLTSATPRLTPAQVLEAMYASAPHVVYNPHTGEFRYAQTLRMEAPREVTVEGTGPDGVQTFSLQLEGGPDA
jgi:hypothetical protein